MIGTIAFVAWASAVAAQDAASREADMFGGASDESAPDAKPADATPTEAKPEDRSSEAPPDARVFEPENKSLLEKAESALDVGGQVFLRMNGSMRQDETIQDMTLTSPSLVDAYMDVRPNDRVRAFTQLRLTYDFTVEPGEKDLFGNEKKSFELLFDQGWIKFDVGRIAYITVGRQHIRWGTGRFWNPTDFINQDVRNSVDFFDNRLGVNLLKVHFPFEALGWNLYLLGTFDGIDVLEDTGVGARAEFLFGQTELAVSSLVKKDQPLRLGLDASTGLWIFDLRAEASVQRGLAKPRYTGDFDLETGVQPTEQRTDDDIFFASVLGGDVQLKYTDQDTLVIGGEYFFNQAGYANAKLYPYLILNNAFPPFYLGQHYIGVYVNAASPFSFNETSLTLSTLGNLSDQSFLTRFDFQQLILTYVTLNAFAAVHYGKRGEFKLGVDIPPVPQVPQLVNGFTLADELLDVGIALRVQL